MKSGFEHNVKTVEVGEKLATLTVFLLDYYLVAPLRNDRSVT